MINDNECNSSEKQHYLAVRRLNALLKHKSHHSGDYCLDCLKTREKQAILLMINDNECNSSEKQHYLVVRRLNALLKHKLHHSGDYCLDCFKLFRNVSDFKNQEC